MRTFLIGTVLVFCIAADLKLSAAEPSWARPASATDPLRSSKKTRAQADRQTPIQLVEWVSPISFPWPDGELEIDGAVTQYGPPETEPRKTLFQWSYGTSFGGAPDLEEPLVTDRPDFTEASSTVGRGVLQIESGYTYVRNDDPGENLTTHSIGEVLFRYGVYADWLELRLQVLPIRQIDSTGPGPSTTVNGVADLYLGAKIGITPQEGILPEMALMPQMFVPSGHSAFTSNEVLPGVNWLYGWDVNDFLSWGGSTQFNYRIDGGTGHKYTEWAQSITFNYSLAEKVGAYTEWFMLTPSGADTERTQHYMDGGFTYQPNADMQFDIRVGIGLSGASDDYFVGTGYSIRIK